MKIREFTDEEITRHLIEIDMELDMMENRRLFLEQEREIYQNLLTK